MSWMTSEYCSNVRLSRKNPIDLIRGTTHIDDVVRCAPPEKTNTPTGDCRDLAA